MHVLSFNTSSPPSGNRNIQVPICNEFISTSLLLFLLLRKFRMVSIIHSINPFFSFFPFHSFLHPLKHHPQLFTEYWAQLIPGVTSAKPLVSLWLKLTECCITGFRNTTQALLVDRSDINPRVCLHLAPRGQIWRVRRKGVPGGFTPSSLFMYWLFFLPSSRGVNLCLTLLNSAPLGLLLPELSCPSPPRPWAPMASMSAPSLWPCSWGVCFSVHACRPHFPAMNLLRHPGLYAQLVIQKLTHKLVLSSQLQYYYSHMCTDKYNTGTCTCLHNMHMLIHAYSLQK